MNKDVIYLMLLGKNVRKVINNPTAHKAAPLQCGIK